MSDVHNFDNRPPTPPPWTWQDGRTLLVGKNDEVVLAIQAGITPSDADADLIESAGRLAVAESILARFVEIYGRGKFPVDDLRSGTIEVPAEDHAEMFFEVLLPAMSLLGMAGPEQAEGRAVAHG